MQDPNWLLSTCAQSAAAIVAIIGGFIISTVLNISSEKNSIKKELKELQELLDYKKLLLNSHKKELIEIDCDDFINEHLFDVVEIACDKCFEHGGLEDFNVDFEKYYIKSDYNVDKKVLEDKFYQTIDLIKEAFNYFLNNLDKFKELPNDFSEFLYVNKIELDSDKKNIYEEVYETTIRKIQSNRNPYGISTMSIIGNRSIVPGNLIENEHYDNLKNEKQKIEHEIDYLETQIREKESKFGHIEKPSGLNGALIVFIYFTLAGIVFPIFLLPVDASKFSGRLKYLVSGLFTSGLLSVIVYIVMTIRSIFDRR